MEKKFQLKLINMKTYTATSQNSRNFILENENQEILGELIYPKWYSTKAEIHIGSKIFKTDTKGFWTTSVEVTEYERVLLKFKMDWKGNIIMTSLQDGEKHFIIKKEKWYSNILVMKDENEKVYFHLKRNFKWKDFKFHYEIALEEDLDELTLLSIVHVVNYFSSQDDGSAATTAATV